MGTGEYARSRVAVKNFVTGDYGMMPGGKLSDFKP
jgi:hypothetical protein